MIFTEVQINVQREKAVERAMNWIMKNYAKDPQNQYTILRLNKVISNFVPPSR